MTIYDLRNNSYEAKKKIFQPFYIGVKSYQNAAPSGFLVRSKGDFAIAVQGLICIHIRTLSAMGRITLRVSSISASSSVLFKQTTLFIVEMK